MGIQRSILTIGFLFFATSIFHILFSHLGFNPTDDGFTLAYSRRLVEGQIPHRDFIIIRPALSPLLHSPFVLLAGNHTFLASRFFVWFQLLTISWIWIYPIEKLSTHLFKIWEKISFVLIAFVLSAHTFPLMAWHTIDGLFFTSLGLLLCVKEKTRYKFAGYFLIGMAYLCKQSFIFAAPLVLIILRDWRKVQLWIALLLPGILYLLLLFLTNSLPDAILQLTSQNDIVSYILLQHKGAREGAIVARYLLCGIFLGLIAALLSLKSPLSRTKHNLNWVKLCGLSILSLLPLLHISINFVNGKNIKYQPFGVLGLLIGILTYLYLNRQKGYIKEIKIGLLLLTIAFCVFLSIGYSNPGLVTGLLFVTILIYIYPTIRENLPVRIYQALLITSLSIVLLSFVIARRNHIYRELPASNLTQKLDKVLPGGSGLKSNKYTYYFLYSLQEAIEISVKFKKTYTILPDCAGLWVKSPAINPLSIDWIQQTELNKPELVSRIIKELVSMRSSNIVIVQKVSASNLKKGYLPLDGGERFAVVNYIRNNFTKIRETTLFELYQ